MRILKVDRENNFFEVVPESLDDLWHLEKVLEKGDIVSGKSERKIKPSKEGEKTFRETIFVEISVEKIEFHKFSGMLRLNGVIVGGKPLELIELKAHHALEVFEGHKIKVQKQRLKNYQVERLEKAKNASAREKFLLVVLDDEEAELALLKDFGFEFKGKIFAGKEGKRYKSEKKGNDYFDELLKKVHEIKAEKVLFAGPGFTKQNLQKYLGGKGVKLKAFFDSTNSIGSTGLNELVKSGAVDKIVKDLQLSKETMLVERLFLEISRNGNAVYGASEVKRAVDFGAVEVLLVSEERLLEEREEIEKLMDSAEKNRAEVHLIGSENEPGKKLKGIGGIAAITRYKIG
ncbi:MAG: mRNA surveillance protein pelota [Candidatus Diapherotrites archaeon]